MLKARSAASWVKAWCSLECEGITIAVYRPRLANVQLLSDQREASPNAVNCCFEPCLATAAEV